MPPTSSPNLLQQPHQYDGSSPELHDQPGDFHGGGGISTLPTSQQALPNAADPAYHEPPHPPNPSTHIGFDHPGWKSLIIGPLATRERVFLITAIFSSRDKVEAIKRLSGEDAQIFVDAIYEMLDDLDHTLRIRCLRFLCKICSRHALLPASLVIPVSYDRTKAPMCHGGFADVWKGISRGLEVVVKELKLYQCNDQEKIRRGFCREVVAWSALRHPNVLPLLGATITGDQFAMVSEWMVNGNINEFIKAHPDADRLELLRDVGRGLDYLHGRRMIHGDLKGVNILINHDGNACIADFGLLTIIPDQASFASTITRTEGGTLRWMSPELLDPESFGLKNSCPTKESDCYALAMVIYEVLSGQAPFSQCKGHAIVLRIMGGERPERPQGWRAAWFTDDLWEMLELCWKSQPSDRPSLSTLLQCLEGVTPPSRSPSPTPTTDDDVETSTDDLLGFTVTDPSPSSTPSSASTVKQLEVGGIDLDRPPLPSPECTVILPPPRVIDSPSTSALPDMLYIAPIAPSLPAKPLTVTRTGKVFATSQNPTRGEAAILEFVNSDLAPELSRQRAVPLLKSKNLLRDVRGLTLEGRARFVDKVDEVYPTIDPQTAKFVTVLGNVCGTTEQLPPSAVLSVGLKKHSNTAAASGGLTDVWRGEYNGMQVAIKAFRTYPAQNLKEAKEILWKRVPMWRRLSHENILSFRGVDMTFFELALVYEWGPNGNINKYIALHPGVSRPSLLFDVVKGLQYLHSLDIAHGFLKGANVIVDQRGHARLTEYGLAPINSDPRFAVAATPGAVGMSRWLAPEIINPRRGNSAPVMESKPADVFAFAMFSVEVFTGKIPFEEQKNEAVVLRILLGGRPEMPVNAQVVGLTGEMWKLLESCWRQNPRRRPTMEEVVKRWQKFVGHENDDNDVETKAYGT